MMELLSPAGGWEAMVAAVQNGADAVYMGFGGLNARRSARNFTDEEFREAVAYCHLRGVKVYLTLNTLVTDRELPAAAEALKKASDMGVDAILIQDWGIWRLAREIAPDVPLHASTQMSLHTLGGACRAAELGLERVVLARELSRRDIHTITRGCPAEIEVFGHGALCMCYSGQCEMSAVIGGRSGNRGACAQPCRLPYGVNEKAAGGHPLSLKDANLADYVQELEQMGVACLKLEGRMKRPEYVAVITGIYRRLLDEKRGPSREESRQLEAAFSRSGFTDGYYKGRTGPEMFGTRPENAPEPKELFARGAGIPDGQRRGTHRLGGGSHPGGGPEPGIDGGGIAIPAGKNRRHRVPAPGHPGGTGGGADAAGQRRERPAAAGSGGPGSRPGPAAGAAVPPLPCPRPSRDLTRRC